MKKFLLISLVFLASAASGQNLINNFSFEDTVSCPDNSDQVNRTVGWSRYGGSPDYFNSCTSTWYVSVPNNGGGYQNAATGVAYCGFYSRYSLAAKERIGTQLTVPMIVGNQYYVSLQVSAAYGGGINCATNKLGVLFSTQAYSAGNPAPVDNFAHIYTDSIVSDTTDWVTIDGIFTADSAYSYIIIGNFFDDAVTDTLILDTSTYCLSYYFVDDIYVSDSVTGIWDYSQSMNDVSVFPVPAKDRVNVNVNLNGIKGTEYTLLNNMGQIIKKMKISEYSFFIDKQNLPDGLYFLIIHGNYTITKKIIFIH